MKPKPGMGKRAALAGLALLALSTYIGLTIWIANSSGWIRRSESQSWIGFTFDAALLAASIYVTVVLIIMITAGTIVWIITGEKP